MGNGLFWKFFSDINSTWGIGCEHGTYCCFRVNPLAPKNVKTRLEKVQKVGPSLSTITPYHSIFIKIDIDL